MSRARKYFEVLAFVAIWMAAGWTFHLRGNSYLLLGVPLVVLFQLFIARRPLRDLWARNSASFHLGWLGLLLAALLMLAPAYDLITMALPKKLWIVALWLVCAMAGAVFGAFALREQRAIAARQALPAFLAAIIIGIGFMAVSALARHHPIGFPLPRLLYLLRQLLLYFAVCFALEEVAFRGALDSHLYRPSTDGQTGKWPWLTAIVVSALWGIWHLPILPLHNVTAVAAAVAPLVIIHILIGVPLSFCWRTSGTLVLPALAHALIDAYRNTVL